MKVSVIIPYSTYGSRVKRCLDALAHQSFTDYETIFINDYSEDEDIGFIDKMLASMPNVTQVNHNSRHGLWRTRCEGVKLAKGEYILFMDPREWLDSSALQNLVETMDYFNVDLVQMKRRSVAAKLHLKSPDHPDVIYDKRIDGEYLRSISGYIGKDSCVSPFCGDKLYRRDLLLEACMMDFPGKWGEVQMMNINYMRYARSATFINYCGVLLDWSDDYANYQFRRLQDFKFLYTMKKRLCLDKEALRGEMRYLLHYHVRQLMKELVWTPEAVIHFMGNELSDPLWREVGMSESLEEIIHEERQYLKQYQWKSLFKRILK